MDSTYHIILSDLKAKYGMYELLSSWDWEFHITLSFNSKVSSKTAFTEVKRMLNYCRKGKYSFNQMKVGAILLYYIGKGNNHHVHVTLVSDPTYPKTLSQIDRSKFSVIGTMDLYWSFIGRIKVDKAYDLKGLCIYLGYKNFNPSDMERSDFDYWHLPVLMKLKRNQRTHS